MTPFHQVSPARAPLLVEGRDRTLSFHERATSKDVIDELNRMIRKGEDHPAQDAAQTVLEKLDLACCCPTGWVHVERDIDFTDPKVRIQSVYQYMFLVKGTWCKLLHKLR